MRPEDFYILIGCEESQAVCIEFRKLGFNAFSCDLKPCSGGHPEWHIHGNVFDALLFRKWDLAVFHPDCTYLAVTANKWLKEQPARKSGALVGSARGAAREEAIEFFMALANTDIDHIALENPIGCISTTWRKPDQIIQPYEYGYPETKKTCLWLKNLPKLTPTNIVQPEFIIYGGKKYSPTHAHNWGNSELRSKTYIGIAQAMAQQWGNYLLIKHLL